MARYDSSSAEILVFTFKEGLLSAVAHDLKLKATKFSLDVEGDAATLELEAGSLRVVTPMKDGVEHPSAISSSKFAEIEKNAFADVLEAKRHPLVRFVTTQVTDTTIVGKLTLHGQTHEVRGRRSGQTAEFQLDQRTFGIKPYSAMLGALKVKPELTIKVKLSS